MTMLRFFIVFLILSKVKGQFNISQIISDVNFTDIIAGLESATLFSVLKNGEKFCQYINEINNDEERNKEMCFQQLKILCANQTLFDLMWDASSKFPYTGMLIKFKLDLGSFDECVNLDYTEGNIRILGKHCSAALIIPTTEKETDPDFISNAYKLSICMPDQCDAKSLLKLANLNQSYQFLNDNSCHTKYSKDSFGWDAILTIAFTAILLFIISVASIYDFYYSYYYSHEINKFFALQAFSAYRNTLKLFTFSSLLGDEIRAIHGLRVLSMMWIVLGHSFIPTCSFPTLDKEFCNRLSSSFESFYVSTADFAVDTFFFLSGFLVPYTYLKGKPQTLKTHLKNVPFMIIHRYLRLTPVLAYIIAFDYSILPFLGNGPLYEDAFAIYKKPCRTYWWSLLLYVQNYVNYKDMCMVVTWYLCADWQLFLISPLILIPVALLIKSHFNRVISSLILLNILCIVIPVTAKLIFNDIHNQYDTQSRLTGYFIGFLLGVFMRERKDVPFRISGKLNAIIWMGIMSFMTLTTVIYKKLQILTFLERNERYRTYSIILRGNWCICLCWILYSCNRGYAGFVNKILANNTMQLLSRLNYCIYLIHSSVIYYFLGTMREPLESGHLNQIVNAIAAYVISAFLAVFVTLALESSVIALLKHYLRK